MTAGMGDEATEEAVEEAVEEVESERIWAIERRFASLLTL